MTTAGDCWKCAAAKRPSPHFCMTTRDGWLAADVRGSVERYLYGDADELLAVTDATGRPLRLLVRTPLGVHAQVQGALGVGEVLFCHADERGTLRLITDMAGAIRARFAYECFGQPLPANIENADSTNPCFTGRDWYAAIGLYYFGARWYDPALGRFLTPDSYTGAPDDARSAQSAAPVQPASGGCVGKSLANGSSNRACAMPYAFCCQRSRSAVSIRTDIGRLVACC